MCTRPWRPFIANPRLTPNSVERSPPRTRVRSPWLTSELTVLASRLAWIRIAGDFKAAQEAHDRLLTGHPRARQCPRRSRSTPPTHQTQRHAGRPCPSKRLFPQHRHPKSRIMVRSALRRLGAVADALHIEGFDISRRARTLDGRVTSSPTWCRGVPTTGSAADAFFPRPGNDSVGFTPSTAAKDARD